MSSLGSYLLSLILTLCPDLCHRFVNMTSISGLMSWFAICVSYVRFYRGMKAQGFDRKTLPFRSRLQPFLGWYGVFSTIIICFVSS